MGPNMKSFAIFCLVVVSASAVMGRGFMKRASCDMYAMQMCIQGASIYGQQPTDPCGPSQVMLACFDSNPSCSDSDIGAPNMKATLVMAIQQMTDMGLC